MYYSEEESSEGSSSEGQEEEEDISDVASDEEQDDEGKPQNRPYMALLQSLNESSAPKAKRRKIAHESNDQSTSRQAKPSENDSAGDLDLVEEEEEEGQENEESFIAPGEDDDSDDETSTLDPFLAHRDPEGAEDMAQLIPKRKWKTSSKESGPYKLVISRPEDMGSFDFSTKVNDQLDELFIKKKLKEVARGKMGSIGDAEKIFTRLLFDYRDVLHCDRTLRNGHKLRQLACLHALNHIFK